MTNQFANQDPTATRLPRIRESSQPKRDPTRGTGASSPEPGSHKGTFPWQSDANLPGRTHDEPYKTIPPRAHGTGHTVKSLRVRPLTRSSDDDDLSRFAGTLQPRARSRLAQPNPSNKASCRLLAAPPLPCPIPARQAPQPPRMLATWRPTHLDPTRHLGHL